MIEIPIKSSQFSLTFDYKGDITKIAFKNKTALKELIDLLSKSYQELQ